MSLFFDDLPQTSSSLAWHETWQHINILQCFLLDAVLESPGRREREVLWDRCAINHAVTPEIARTKRGTTIVVASGADRAWIEAWMDRDPSRRLGQRLPGGAVVDTLDRKLDDRLVTEFVNLLGSPLRLHGNGDRERAIELTKAFARVDTRRAEAEWRTFDACGFECMPHADGLTSEEYHAIGGAISGLDLRTELRTTSRSHGPWPHLDTTPWLRVNRAIRTVIDLPFESRWPPDVDLVA